MNAMARSRPLARWGFATLLCVAPLGLTPSAASAAAALVAGQQVINSSASATSLSASLPVNSTAGNVLIMIGASPTGPLLAPNANPTPGVTGGGVTSWSRAATSYAYQNIEIWYGVVDTTPSKTVTITQCVSACTNGRIWMNVSEWSGLAGAQSQLLDQASAGNGPATPASAPPITTANANDLLIFGATELSGTFGAPSLGGTPGPWTAMSGITGPGVQSSWYQNVSSTYSNLTIQSTAAGTWDAAIAAFKACSVTNATYVVARAQNGQVTVYWSSPNWVTVLRKTSANGAFTTETPTAPGTATTQYSGAAGSLTETVANGTWYYKVFTKCAASYSTGTPVTPVPATTSLWSYTMPVAALTTPGIDDQNVVIFPDNNGDVHGVDATLGTLEFPVFTQPTSGIQARPPIIPAGYSQTGLSIAYVTSQDGNVYAINTATGALVWKKLVLTNGLQGGAAVWLQQFQGLSICGATVDAVFVGTRDTGAGGITNKVYALNGGTQTVATTTALGGNCLANPAVAPGDPLWTFTGSTPNAKMDLIVSTPYVDYTNYSGKYALWVTSNAASGLTQPSLWRFNVENGALFNGSTTSCTSPSTACWNLGHTDSSPTPSGDGAWIYVGTNCIPAGCATQAATLNAVPVAGGTVQTYNPGTTGSNGTGNIKNPYPMLSTSFGTQSAGVTYVNSKSTSSSGTSCAVDMSTGASPTNGLTAGNTIVVLITYPLVGYKTATVYDNRVGSVYSRRRFLYNASPTVAVELWTGTLGTGSGTTVTVSFGLTSTTSICAVAQYSGVGAVNNAVAGTFSNTTSGTNASLGPSATTLDTNNRVVAVFGYGNNSAFTAGASSLRTSITTTGLSGAIVDNGPGASRATVTNSVTHATGTWVGLQVELRSVTVDQIVYIRDQSPHAIQFAGSLSTTVTTTFNPTWQSCCPGNPSISGPVDDGQGRMYFGMSTGKLAQYDAWSGSGGVWNDLTLHPAPQIAPGALTILGDPSYDGVLNRLYVGGNDGRVYAVTPGW